MAQHLHHDLISLKPLNGNGERIAGMHGRRKRRRNVHPEDLQQVGYAVELLHRRLHDVTRHEQRTQRLGVGSELRQLLGDGRFGAAHRGRSCGRRIYAGHWPELRHEVDEMIAVGRYRAQTFLDALKGFAGLASLPLLAARTRLIARTSLFDAVSVELIRLLDRLAALFDLRRELLPSDGRSVLRRNLGLTLDTCGLRRLQDRGLKFDRPYGHGFWKLLFLKGYRPRQAGPSAGGPPAVTLRLRPPPGDRGEGTFA